MPNVFQALADEARARNLPIAAHVPLMMTADEAGPRALPWTVLGLILSLVPWRHMGRVAGGPTPCTPY